MGLDVKGKGKPKDSEEEGMKEKEIKVESEDEEESRARIVKKRKVDKVDLFTGKKKSKTKPKIEPAVVSTPTKHVTQSPSIQETPIRLQPEQEPSQASTPTKSSPEVPTRTSIPTLDGLNKNQRKKLRKKQKKMAQVVET